MSMLGGIVGGAAINVAMGPLLGFAQRKLSYVLTDKEIDLTAKDVFPLDAPAIIQHVVSSYWRPDKAVNSMKSNGFFISNWTDQFFQHTALANPLPDSMLGLYVDKFQPPQFNEASQADMAAWSAQSSPDIVPIHTLLNRGNISRQVANNWMRRQGYRDDVTTELMLSLRNEVPPLSDLIRMAVRDSFTVDSVAHYKEANEYPTVLDKYVRWIGLDWPTGLIYPPSVDDVGQPQPAKPATWGHIYWASHWIEPSPTQAYEMIFRGYRNSPHGPSPYILNDQGAIDPDLTFNEQDLNRLLKSADYGPYWRKRLEMIAYHPLNITDIKRMYRFGVLDEAGIYHGMRAQGYNDSLSRTLTQYVMRTERPQITSEVGRAFISGIFSEPQARQALQDGGLSQREINFALTKWKLDVRTKIADQGLKLIRQSRLMGLASEDVTRAALNQLGIDGPRIEEYLRRWDMEVRLNRRIPTLRVLLRWYVDGLITRDDIIGRLQRLRYEDVDINRILREGDLRKQQSREKDDKARERERERDERKAEQEQSTARQRADKERKEIQRIAKERDKEAKERAKLLEAASKEQQSTRDNVVREQQQELEAMLDQIRKGSTDKYLIAFYRKGLLNIDEVRQRLSIRGLTVDDVDRWVTTYLKGVLNG